MFGFGCPGTGTGPGTPGLIGRDSRDFGGSRYGINFFFGGTTSRFGFLEEFLFPAGPVVGLVVSIILLPFPLRLSGLIHRCSTS